MSRDRTPSYDNYINSTDPAISLVSERLNASTSGVFLINLHPHDLRVLTR